LVSFNKQSKLNKKTQGKNRQSSLSKKLQKQSKSTDEFEVMLNNLSLEEVIGLKLELAAKAAGGMLYGLPIWYSLKNITNDAVLKYAYSATSTKMEAARFLGLDKNRFNQLVKKYQIESYFEEKD
tara:strand:- start:1127 stop:1501 length:375 start_codon:yes stop_codon:yes gene_type:complete